jgi:acyl-CoA reductase-like NAD-dependent aldehyde dehydrogenase
MATKLQNYVNGKFQDPKDGKYIDNINPADGTVVNLIPESTATDVDEAVAAATAALSRPDWGHAYVSAKKRSEWLSKIADGIQERLEIFAQAESKDTGACYAVAVCVMESEL